ncbi:MAG: hypothetical protein USCAAHI_00944 [Beijerinckiaceae bacterium]|nr:MAG: hypothetical protein USCAAHI_00944 [Beijerinckiaceae bacterium]
MNTVRKSPIVQRRRLIERLGLLFQQRQIMQGVVDEIGRLVAARMHGDRLITADDLTPVDISGGIGAGYWLRGARGAPRPPRGK